MSQLAAIASKLKAMDALRAEVAALRAQSTSIMPSASNPIIENRSKNKGSLRPTMFSI